MHTIAFPLVYLMVAINPATGQWEGVNSNGAFEDTQTAIYTDQKTCLAAREQMAAPGIYFCLAYKDPQYMMEILQNGHWLPLDGRGMTYGSGHGVSNVSYRSKKACLAARQERLGYDIHPAHPAPYRCVPYSDSYVDKDDPPSWTLLFRPRDGPSSRLRWFYTRADCVSMGRYWVFRNLQATFECIHS